MLFSAAFEIERKRSEDWFDPFLTIDSKIWIDPFLIYSQEFGPFIGAHEEVVAFFQVAYEAVAKSKGSVASAHWRRATRMLAFPERPEFCLGYTDSGTDGSGSGPDLTKALVAGLWRAIELGLKNLDHFEEVQIFQRGIGPDRVSDAVAKILFSRFVEYTQLVCDRHGVETTEHHYLEGRFNQDKRLWEPLHFQAPVNPISGQPVLLCPQFFLRTLPTINANDFWKFSAQHSPDIINAKFGDDIQSRVDKGRIIDLAVSYPDLVDQFVEHARNSEPQPYPFKLDPQLLFRWYMASQKWAASTPLDERALKTFPAFLKALAESFRDFVEQNRGWQLLWNDNGTPRAEEAAQNLFMGVVSHYCRANDIDVSREANIGRGPVDFKVSRGWRSRALVELKLAKNTKFWSGLRRQLPTYMKAEGIKQGVFLVVCFNDKDLERIGGIEAIARSISKTLGYKIDVEVVDASKDKPSASKLT